MTLSPLSIRSALTGRGNSNDKMFALNCIVITHKITRAFCCRCCFCSFVVDPQWRTADAEIKVFSAENQERLKGLPLKPGESQNIDMRTSPTASNFFLSDSYTTFGPIKIFFFFVFLSVFCFFFKPLLKFFPSR